MHILITGFEPYDSSINASEQLVRELQNTLPDCDTHQYQFAILPCNTLTLNNTLNTLFATHTPDLCVLIGQAPGRGKIELERIGLNLKDFTAPDNAGAQPRGEKIVADGPLAYEATLANMQHLVSSLNDNGIPSAISNYAGCYLCNQALYYGLHLAATQQSATQIGFVHVPLLPEQGISKHAQQPTMTLDRMATAIKHLISELTNHRQR